MSAANTTFHLNNVLDAPALVRNLLSVRQFTHDNSCSIEFDTLGFSVKDLQMGRVILRCNSGEDLYTITPTPPTCSLATSATLWHHRLGHPGPSTLATLQNISCNKQPQSLCHACQLGKHTRLPFSSSTSVTTSIVELLHCDVWTSPVLSTSGFKYYLVMLDDLSFLLDFSITPQI